MPHLIVNVENHDYQIYRFVKKINIGRHPNCDLILRTTAGETISRRHAYIMRDDQGYQLIDCSLNGTRVDNELIKSHRLRHGDRFQIAEYNITFLDDMVVQVAHESHLAEDAQIFCDDEFDETEKVMCIEAVNEGVADEVLKTKLKALGIIVEDVQMLALYRDILAVSRINVPILILGEPGTGKEKVAQAVHALTRAKGEFVALNCSAIPDNLFENELFGSTKGAFSDATNKPGKLEMADQGTLFLDEIGDMSRGCQPKLLRFLECRSLSRLGETRIRNLDIRIVAATNQDLNGMVKTKDFRADLFQRLACVKLRIPPLRNRCKDILPLAQYFLKTYARQYDLNLLKISAQASKIMLAYSWPGNVRELANIMLNVCVRAKKGCVMPDHLTAASEEMGEFVGGVDTDFVSLQVMEKNHIYEALKKAGNNKTKASEMLGIAKDTLYRKIKKYETI